MVHSGMIKLQSVVIKDYSEAGLSLDRISRVSTAVLLLVDYEEVDIR